MYTITYGWKFRILKIWKLEGGRIKPNDVHPNGGFQSHGSTLKWMVYGGKYMKINGWFGGLLFQETSNYIQTQTFMESNECFNSDYMIYHNAWNWSTTIISDTWSCSIILHQYHKQYIMSSWNHNHIIHEFLICLWLSMIFPHLQMMFPLRPPFSLGNPQPCLITRGWKNTGHWLVGCAGRNPLGQRDKWTF